MPLPIAENRDILKDANGAELVIAEKTSFQFTATLVDETGTAIPLAGVSTLVLTIYNRDSAGKEILNSVENTDIKDTGRGSLHATNGLLTVTLQPADNAIVDGTVDLEWHRALIQGTYASGTKAFKYEIDFPVRNLNKVS